MPLVFDIESNGLLDTVTKVHCIVIKDPITKEVNKYHGDTLPHGLSVLMNADLIIGHNIQGYDIMALEKVYGVTIATPILDTLLCSRLIWTDLKTKDLANFRAGKFPGNLIGKHSLKAWGYRLGMLKGEFGETTDWKEFTPEMLEYCVQDVEVTCAFYGLILGKAYSQAAIDLEHAFAAIIRKQEQFGFCFDEKAALALYSSLSGRRQELRMELLKQIPGWDLPTKTPAHYTLVYQGGYIDSYPTKGAAEAYRKQQKWKAKDCVIAPGPNKTKHIEFNPASRKHIHRWFSEKYHWEPKEFTENGEPVIDDDVLAALVYPEAKTLAEYFLVEKRIGQLAEGDQAWLKLVKNGRIHGSVCTNGAVTGRCTHSHPNVAQVPKVSKKGNPYGAEYRSFFGPPPGMVEVGCDASGLELRCLAHFMARYDGGEYAKVILEGDIHSVNQAAAGLPTRDNAKTFIYAFLYGAGDEKIGSIVGKGAKEGKRLKEQFLNKTPALKRLREDVAQAAKLRGHLKGLDGRLLHVRSQHAALNTLLQSAGALVMKKALVILYGDLTSLGCIHGRDFAFLANIHDEFQIACLPDLAEQIGKIAAQSITKAGEAFGFRCPLAGEFKVGRNWAETH